MMVDQSVGFDGVLLFLAVFGWFFVQNKRRVMYQQIEKQGQLPESSRSNTQNEEQLSESNSLKSHIQHSDCQNTASKGKPFSRKPDTQTSNLQTFKLLRRKSQQKTSRKSQEHKLDQPPRYPRPSQQFKQQTSETGPSTQPSAFSTLPRQFSPNNSDSGVRFKKKAMSKEQIIEVKAFIHRSQIQQLQTNSITGSQKGAAEVKSDQKTKDSNKKSKTQYFQYQHVHGSSHTEVDVTENSSDSHKIEVASLKERCQSADETNNLLQKRLKWLREEVQMHLERQLECKKEREELCILIKQKDQLYIEQRQKREQMTLELNSKNKELQKLKMFVIDLNQRYDDDRQILTAQIEYLKSQKDIEVQQLQKSFMVAIQELQHQINKLKNEKVKKIDQEQPDERQTCDNYSQLLIQKLTNENKYLKMENHMLGRYKEEVSHLKRQAQQLSNQRDTLKKKIIQTAKKQALRMRMFDDSDSSQTISLSQLSYSISHRK